MAKTRAQRKAEQRRRQQQAPSGGSKSDASEPQVAERAEPSKPKAAKAKAKTKAKAEPTAPAPKEPRRLVRRKAREAEAAIQPPPVAAIPGVTPEPVQVPLPVDAEVEQPDDEVGAPEERKAGKQLEKEQRRKDRARELQKGKAAAPAEPGERRRTGVAGFLASCVAELRRVQWPDRDALVQASAVTLLFVVVMAAYLGALDAVFNFMIKQIL